MLSDKLANALNDQMNFEYLSAHYYRGMEAYFTNNSLDGFATFFKEQIKEELFHADKFYNFISEIDADISIQAIDDVKNDFESCLDVFKVALDHEREVTKRIYNIMSIATDEKEFATLSFLNWFTEEQVEEENTMKDIIVKLERIKDDPQAIYMLDAELGQRVFVPPSGE